MKGVIYSLEKPYSGLENGWPYWGEVVNRGAEFGKDCKLYLGIS